MPCILPEEYHTFGVKVVDRIRGNHPALKSKLSLFDTLTGDMTALMDSNWITSMRTGAVAALAAQTFSVHRGDGSMVYAIMGLGNIAVSTMQCLLALFDGQPTVVKLLRYKNQAEAFAELLAESQDLTRL